MDTETEELLIFFLAICPDVYVHLAKVLFLHIVT